MKPVKCIWRRDKKHGSVLLIGDKERDQNAPDRSSGVLELYLGNKARYKVRKEVRTINNLLPVCVSRLIAPRDVTAEHLASCVVTRNVCCNDNLSCRRGWRTCIVYVTSFSCHYAPAEHLALSRRQNPFQSAREGHFVRRLGLITAAKRTRVADRRTRGLTMPCSDRIGGSRTRRRQMFARKVSRCKRATWISILRLRGRRHQGRSDGGYMGIYTPKISPK